MKPLAGSQKITISIATLAALVVGAWQFHEWTGRHIELYLVTRANAAEITEQIKQATDAAKQAAQAAKEIGQALTEHVAGQELKEARTKLDSLKRELSETQLWESANGSNEISRRRKLELEQQIDRTSAYIACMEAERDRCSP